MMGAGIKLGLENIKHLMRDVPLTWRAIHVAGTNGKGSTCAYIAAMLRAANIRVGRFSSPHLMDRWDGISINEQSVSKSLFLEVEDRVRHRNESRGIGASSFELLTATAFEIFNRESVEVGVIECGMGGRTDATNVITDPLVSVITAIGLDHQAFLGDTIAEIAAHKSGIIKPGAPCAVSRQNEDDAIRIITRQAISLNSRVDLSPAVESRSQSVAVLGFYDREWSPAERFNMSCAMTAVKAALPGIINMGLPLPFSSQLSSAQISRGLAPAMLQSGVPGRYEAVSIESITGRRNPVLMDGAHNAHALEMLRQHVDKNIRGVDAVDDGVVWLVAQSTSDSKSPQDMLKILGRDNDVFVATEFSPVDGMPWVSSSAAKEFTKPLDGVNASISVIERPHFVDALEVASSIAEDRPMVITGSLYLISDVLRLLRSAEQGII